jgi:uncharacterized protein
VAALLASRRTSFSDFATGVESVAGSPGHPAPASATTPVSVGAALTGQNETVTDDDIMRRIFTEFDHITVVGCSRDPSKEAHAIPARMQRHGYRITPINPYADELLGEPVYRQLADVPHALDVVLVFRPSRDATDAVRQAVECGAAAVWLQQGIRSSEGRALCEGAGVLYVEDHCMAVDYIRLDIDHQRAAS